MVYKARAKSLCAFPRGWGSGARNFVVPGRNLRGAAAYREVVGTMELATNIDEQNTG